jgi:hypothetical protein
MEVKPYKIVLHFLFTTMLAACGGGGGSSAPVDLPPFVYCKWTDDPYIHYHSFTYAHAHYNEWRCLYEDGRQEHNPPNQPPNPFIPAPPPPPPPPPTPSCGGGVTERLNVSSEECEANKDTSHPGVDLSDDGRYASFVSSATNLVVGDNNNGPDVFIRDRITGVTTKISSARNWPSTSISGDGSLVAYNSNIDIKVANTLTLVSEVIARGSGPSMSGDGRYVAFYSSSALVPEDTNSVGDIYVYDRQGSIMRRVSQSSAGLQANNSSQWAVISADGSTVAFRSFATNLIASDTNGTADVYIHKLNSSETQLVSITPGGGQFVGGTSNQPGISADGRYVVFSQHGPEGTYLRDVMAGTTVKIGGGGIDPDISADGRYIVYESYSYRPIAGDTNSFDDIVVYDVQTQKSMLAVIGINADPTNSNSKKPAISSDGKFIAFSSDATNLVAGDTNAVRDVFIVENPLFP